MRILVLSNSSFLRGTVRLGLQQLALEWSKTGNSVDYVACPTTIVDFLSPSRRVQFFHAWLGKGPKRINNSLTEYFVKAPFARSRRYWFSRWQLNAYSLLFPKFLKKKNYDLCVFDVSYPALFIRHIQANNFCFRVNDHPQGLLHHMSPFVAKWFEKILEDKAIDLACPVSPSLFSWVKSNSDGIPILYLPNGVDLKSYRASQENNMERKSQSAVYVGSFNPWFDWSLFFASARALPDWQFDLYGPLNNLRILKNSPSNISYLGTANYDDLPTILSKYSVGLIPFKASENFLDHYDPLKAYQYLAAGLSIAATDLGRTRQALNSWAFYGKDEKSFVAAIVDAGSSQETLVVDSNLKNQLSDRDWPSLAESVIGMVKSL